MTSAGETLPGGIELIRDDNDLLGGRHAVRSVALQLGFDLVGQTMIGCRPCRGPGRAP